MSIIGAQQRLTLNNCMNKTALQDIQRTLNIIHNQIWAAGAETKWAALELMLASSASIVALAENTTKPDTKATTRIISVLKKSSNSLYRKQVNPLVTAQFELLSNPLLLKSRYPINKSASKSQKISY